MADYIEGGMPLLTPQQLERDIPRAFSMRDDSWGALHVSTQAIASYDLWPQGKAVAEPLPFVGRRQNQGMSHLNILVCAPEEFVGLGFNFTTEPPEEGHLQVMTSAVQDKKHAVGLVAVRDWQTQSLDERLRTLDEAAGYEPAERPQLMASALAAAAGDFAAQAATWDRTHHSDTIAKDVNTAVVLAGLVPSAIAFVLNQGETTLADMAVPMVLLAGSLALQRSLVGRYLESADARMFRLQAESAQLGMVVSRAVHQSLASYEQ